MTRAIPALLLALACTPTQAPCAFACVLPGYAATAGHCVGQTDPAVLVPASSCYGSPVRRRAEPGEQATVGTRRLAIVDTWLGYVVLNGACFPGESGSGVYGADGALLGIVIRNHSDQCYAEIL